MGQNKTGLQCCDSFCGLHLFCVLDHYSIECCWSERLTSCEIKGENHKNKKTYIIFSERVFSYYLFFQINFLSPFHKSISYSLSRLVCVIVDKNVETIVLLGTGFVNGYYYAAACV